MPDVLAAIGIGQMESYLNVALPKRIRIFEEYNDCFSEKDWAIVPEYKSNKKQSSCHIYALRIAGISEYANEISLPIYPQLSSEDITYIVSAVCESVEQVLYAQEKF